jgi:hypothetical protein
MPDKSSGTFETLYKNKAAVDCIQMILCLHIELYDSSATDKALGTSGTRLYKGTVEKRDGL